MYLGLGITFVRCSSFLETINLPLATVIGSQAVLCGEVCTTQCANVYSAVETCGSGSANCYCPVFLESGAGCGSCLATFRPTFVSSLMPLVTACSTECHSQCNNVYIAETSCASSDSSCFCPTYLESGSACSACVSSVLPTFVMRHCHPARCHLPPRRPLQAVSPHRLQLQEVFHGRPLQGVFSHRLLLQELRLRHLLQRAAARSLEHALVSNCLLETITLPFTW